LLDGKIVVLEWVIQLAGWLAFMLGYSGESESMFVPMPAGENVVRSVLTTHVFADFDHDTSDDIRQLSEFCAVV
jgi:hypothetical protein